MNRTTTKIASVPGTVIHILAISLFTLIFTLYYRPTAVNGLLNMQNTSFGFNSTILFCITLLTLSATRWCMFAVRKAKNISGAYYILWCIGEAMITAMFSSLYLVLISQNGHTFFEMSGMAFLYLMTTMVYPYGILWLFFDRYVKNEDSTKAVDENSLIRFYDEYKKLRFVIAHEAIMFIKSEDNYVQIHYLDKNKTHKFILRSSMRALEEKLAKKGLVRCHRSYFINPSYIKIVHRDESGLIVAELNQDGFDSIPISRKYQDAITKLL